MRISPFPSTWIERTTSRRAAGPDWPATLGRGQVFILPSGFGLLASGVALVLLLVALNYQSAPVFLLAFLLGALLQAAMVLTHQQLRGLTIDAAAIEPGFAGEPLHLCVQVGNRRSRSRRGLYCYAGGRRTSAGTDVAPGTHGKLVLALPAQPRGRHWIRGLGLASGEPFGTFRAWCRLQPLEAIVYPQPAANAPPPPGREGDAGEGGALAHPEDFAGLARYRPGDRLGQIAWTAYARSGKLERKHFTGGGQGTRWLDFGEAAGDTESRLSVLASWALEAERGHHPWGLHLPGYRLAPGRGDAHLTCCLRALALFPGPYDAP